MPITSYYMHRKPFQRSTLMYHNYRGLCLRPNSTLSPRNNFIGRHTCCSNKRSMRPLNRFILTEFLINYCVLSYQLVTKNYLAEWGQGNGQLQIFKAFTRVGQIVRLHGSTGGDHFREIHRLEIIMYPLIKNNLVDHEY